LSSLALDDGIARAAAGPRQPVLVSVFLEGGIDSLSVLFPAGDPAYYSLRPKLALPESAGTQFAEDARLRWHPAAAGLATLHDERGRRAPSGGSGRAAVAPAGRPARDVRSDSGAGSVSGQRSGRLPAPTGRARGDDRRRAAAALRRAHRAGPLRHARVAGAAVHAGPAADERLAARIPALPRGSRDRRPCAGPRLFGVGPPCGVERLDGNGL